jgi:hypothetical protein
VALGAVVLYPALASDRLVPLVAGIGALSALLLVAALVFRSPEVVAWAIAFCGAEYAVFLALRGGTVDRWAPLAAAALFLAAELGYGATEGSDSALEGVLVLRSVLWLVAAAAGAAALGAVLLTASGGASAGLGLEALGVAAAVGALAIVVSVVARARR